MDDLAPCITGTHRSGDSKEASPVPVFWPTDYGGAVANSLGYRQHNDRAKEAIMAAGAAMDPEAKVVIRVEPAHRFQPHAGRTNILYTAWEANELPELYRTTTADADAICVPGRFLVDSFKGLWPNKRVEYVPLGVDGERFSFVDRSRAMYRPNMRSARKNGGRPFRFLWVGAPNARKGLYFILEAWRAFCEGVGARMLESTELYVKTTVPLDCKSRRGVVRSGNIIYDDRAVPLQELVGIYHHSHCFVFPSVGEGFGLTAAEAMATGLPLVYTPSTALLDLAPPDAGIGYPVRFTTSRQNWTWPDADARGTRMEVTVNVAAADTTDLARQMLRVFHEPEDALARGRMGAEHIRENFTWDRCGRRLLEIVKSFY